MNAHRAYTIIELLAVLIIAAVIAPIFIRFFKSRTDTWLNITSEFNDFIALAKQDALIARKVHKIIFSKNQYGRDSLILWREENDPDHEGKKKYEEVRSLYLKLPHQLSESVKIQDIYVNGKKSEDLSVYINTDGLVQDTLVHVVRKRKDVEDKGTFILNPFIGTFHFTAGFVTS